ncbi:OmpA family protein [candidate division WOR-3 bacterium]|nr:OmpA family protein [candidate division WOR-3 bacterium]
MVEEDSSLLYENLEIIKDNSDINVELAGHTNSIGSDSENLILSLARADTVRLWLIRNSIDSVRLTTIGFGETEPVADNRTAEGRTQNDRVEFIKK